MIISNTVGSKTNKVIKLKWNPSCVQSHSIQKVMMFIKHIIYTHCYNAS